MWGGWGGGGGAPHALVLPFFEPPQGWCMAFTHYMTMYVLATFVVMEYGNGYDVMKYGNGYDVT